MTALIATAKTNTNYVLWLQIQKTNMNYALRLQGATDGVLHGHNWRTMVLLCAAVASSNQWNLHGHNWCTMVLFDCLSYTVDWGFTPQSTVDDNKPILLRCYSVLQHIISMLYVEIGYVHCVQYCMGSATVIWLQQTNYESCQQTGIFGQYYGVQCWYISTVIKITDNHSEIASDSDNQNDQNG